MPKGMRQRIDNGRFSFHDFWSLPRDRAHEVTEFTDKRVVICISFFKDVNRNGENAHYVGKSVEVGPRLNTHKLCLNSVDPVPGYVYIWGLDAKEGRMNISSHSQPVSMDRRDEYIMIAEQLATSIMSS
jgi:hypothetical protein